MLHQTEPFASRIIKTSDADEMSAFLSGAIAPGIVRLTGSTPIACKIRFLLGDGFLAGRGEISGSFAFEPHGHLPMVMVNIGVAGTFEIETARERLLGPPETILISTARQVRRVVFGDGRSDVVIGIAEDAIRHRIADVIGTEVRAPLDLMVAVDARSLLGSALHGFGSMLYWAFEAESLLQSSPIGLRRYKDAFSDLVLAAIGRDHLVALAGRPHSVSARQVAEAEELMRASSHLPIGVADIARSLGVTIRTLQYAFRRHRQTTPLAALQRIRLEGFRAELESRPHQSIAEIAARWGFTHLGRLAGQYRRAFSERPSDTLRRAARRH